MRISDWSSDVCSSDLDTAHQRERHRVAEAPVEFGHVEEIHAVDAGDRGRDGEDRGPGGELAGDDALALLFEEAVGLEDPRGDVAEARETESGALDMVPQIGRAACRERGCPHGSISGVPGSIK